MVNLLAQDLILKSLDFFLEEDSYFGDITSQSIFSQDSKSTISFVSKNEEDFYLCGIVVIELLKTRFANLKYDINIQDGDLVKKGDEIARISGNTIELLRIERIALNLMQNLSAVTTKTKKFTEIIKNTEVKLLDTRKTIPALRCLSKYAVKLGGGLNHRFSLSDGILIKDTHIDSCGSIKEAIKLARENSHHLLKVEVECRNKKEVEQSLESKADVIMLDNMSPKDCRGMIELIRKTDERVLIEISGGNNEENILSYAQTKPDFISTSAITTSITTVDISAKMTS